MLDSLMPETARAMLLRKFGSPLEEAAIPVPELAPGAILARIAAAGICGSDLDIINADDPRVPADRLPMIPGHEGIGYVEALEGERRDLLGKPVKPGDLIVWNRGIMCGHCYQCAVKRRPSLCVNREVYGITLPSCAPTWLNGCYAEFLYIRPQSEVLILPPDTDPASIVAATCSGGTAAHAAELAQISLGDQVLVIGPGPLGLFCAAFALARGAAEVWVAGTQRSRSRLEIAEAMGCRVLFTDDLPAAADRPFDVVLDAAGTPRSIQQSLAAVGMGGTVALAGLAAPMEPLPIDLYESISRRGVRLAGVWVSDCSHVFQAVSLVLSGRYGLEKLVTHRLPLSQANEALELVRSRQAMKAVLIP